MISICMLFRYSYDMIYLVKLGYIFSYLKWWSITVHGRTLYPIFRCLPNFFSYNQKTQFISNNHKILINIVIKKRTLSMNIM